MFSSALVSVNEACPCDEAIRSPQYRSVLLGTVTSAFPGELDSFASECRPVDSDDMRETLKREIHPLLFDALLTLCIHADVTAEEYLIWLKKDGPFSEKLALIFKKCKRIIAGESTTNQQRNDGWMFTEGAANEFCFMAQKNLESKLQLTFPIVLTEKQLNVGTRRVVLRSQRDRVTSSLVYHCVLDCRNRARAAWRPRLGIDKQGWFMSAVAPQDRPHMHFPPPSHSRRDRRTTPHSGRLHCPGNVCELGRPHMRYNQSSEPWEITPAHWPVRSTHRAGFQTYHPIDNTPPTEQGGDQSVCITNTNTRGGVRSVDRATTAREDTVGDSKADGAAARPGRGGSSSLSRKWGECSCELRRSPSSCSIIRATSISLIHSETSLLASPKAMRIQSPARSLQIFACGNRAPDDAVGRRVFSMISRFPRPLIPVLLHTHLNHPHRLRRPRCYEPPKYLHSSLSQFDLSAEARLPHQTDSITALRPDGFYKTADPPAATFLEYSCASSQVIGSSGRGRRGCSVSQVSYQSFLWPPGDGEVSAGLPRRRGGQGVLATGELLLGTCAKYENQIIPQRVEIQLVARERNNVLVISQPHFTLFGSQDLDLLRATKLSELISLLDHFKRGGALYTQQRIAMPASEHRGGAHPAVPRVHCPPLPNPPPRTTPVEPRRLLGSGCVMNHNYAPPGGGRRPPPPPRDACVRAHSHKTNQETGGGGLPAASLCCAARPAMFIHVSVTSTNTGYSPWLSEKSNSKWGHSGPVDRAIPSGAAMAQWIELYQVGPQWPSEQIYIKWGLSGQVDREILSGAAVVQWIAIPSGALVAQQIERFQVEITFVVLISKQLPPVNHASLRLFSANGESHDLRHNEIIAEAVVLVTENCFPIYKATEDFFLQILKTITVLNLYYCITDMQEMGFGLTLKQVKDAALRIAEACGGEKISIPRKREQVGGGG
ncbi:hypothetical protein PR048_015461 [Dryococelus australis]|uniref:Uncharacterized protein n=1 Tax=Dryococelus australis TaxID=614101 RepID=A0ABQ9HH00_9NEOP|nr:hypothetical protein PR048_015461 [Dryococelus australis]